MYLRARRVLFRNGGTTEEGGRQRGGGEREGAQGESEDLKEKRSRLGIYVLGCAGEEALISLGEADADVNAW